MNNQLIDPDAPLTVHSSNGQTFISMPDEKSVKAANVKSKRRTIRDLGVNPSKSNPIMVIIGYELFGLDDNAITQLTKLDIAQLNEIRNIPQFTEIKNTIIESLMSSSKNDVITRLEQNAMQAAEVYIDALDAPRFSTKMQAADRIFDTLGYKQERDGKRDNPMARGLTINIISDRNSSVEIEGIEDNG